MGLWSFLKRLLFGSADRTAGPAVSSQSTNRSRAARGRPRLEAKRYRRDRQVRNEPSELVAESPYLFSIRDSITRRYLDLSGDGDPQSLADWHLPVFETPQELAQWLDVPIGQLAWLTGRAVGDGPQRGIHYHYYWRRKRSGGERLIESPKPVLKAVQQKILQGILNRVPVHRDCHAFVPGRSIVSNAAPHVGQRVLLKFDLENFYPSITYNRVVAIFRSLGYCREVAIWLARLTTNRVPATMVFPPSGPATLVPYQRRHLPQGAPTSPALANLSAFALDVRLAGLARSFGANYTRYADDLTFSGPQSLIKALKTVIPLVEKVIRGERYRVRKEKRKVLRSNQQQTVTGVVVNERLNVRREEYDRLKAILHNCRKFGPQTQNREQRPDFAAHLHGRIAHVRQLNPTRGEKLLAIYRQVNW